MFQIGDLVIYSGHGICRIHDIEDQTISGETRKYYVLYPLEDSYQLSIRVPVDNQKVQIYALMTKKEAIEVLEAFKESGAEWIEKNHLRNLIYNEMVSSGNRKDMVKVIKSLMLKKIELEENNAKLAAQDRKLLEQTANVLFKELAIALEMDYDEVVENVLHRVRENQQLLF